MKVPPSAYEATVAFYRDVIRLPQIEREGPEVVFQFGGNRLWIDRVPTLSQAELWMEILTNDLTAAAAALAGHNIVRCDEIEPLPDGMRAFWIANPAGIVHLLYESPTNATDQAD